MRRTSFKWKGYRAKERSRYKVMTLAIDEFMRRFLLHILPSGFHRIRYQGLIAHTERKDNLVRLRKFLTSQKTEDPTDAVKKDVDEVDGGDRDDPAYFAFIHDLNQLMLESPRRYVTDPQQAHQCQCRDVILGLIQMVDAEKPGRQW